MKNLFLLLFLLVFGTACSHRERPPLPPTWVPDPNMLDPELARDIREINENSVVFLGDSLTHYAVWRDFFPDVETANAGWGGNMSSDVLARLQPIIDAKPKKIFLLIGGNDVHMKIPVGVTIKCIDEIIKRIKNGTPDTKLYLTSVFPYGKQIRYYHGDGIPENFKELILILNNGIFLLAKNHNLPYLNLHFDVMADSEGYLKAEYTADQLHLLEPGYRAWIAYIDSYVRE